MDVDWIEWLFSQITIFLNSKCRKQVLKLIFSSISYLNSILSNHRINFFNHGVQILFRYFKHDTIFSCVTGKGLLLRLNKNGCGFRLDITLMSTLSCHVYLPINIRDALGIITHRSLDNMHNIGAVRFPKLEYQISLGVVEVEIISKIISQFVEWIILHDDVTGAFLCLIIK